MSVDEDYHRQREPATAGAPLSEAEAALIAVHGRGRGAEKVLELFERMDVDGVAAIAPRATEDSWYPEPFMAPLEENEPWLSASLAAVADARETVLDAGLSDDETVFLGFSQGACVASEFVARNARRYGGLAAFSGGLMGPEGIGWDYDGSLDGTPVLVGSSDSDEYMPLPRVHETADAFRDLGGDVDERIYEGMDHTVNDDEVEGAREIVEAARDADG